MNVIQDYRQKKKTGKKCWKFFNLHEYLLCEAGAG